MIIKKRISFDFLGEEYKDAYGVFISIAVSEFPNISKTIDKQDNSIKKTNLILDLVKSKFLSGEFPDEGGTLQPLIKDDLNGADGELLLTIYNRLMGGSDPKVSRSSETS